MKNSTDTINPVATESMGDKHNTEPTIGKPHRKLTPYFVSKKNWNTKENKGQSMMCVLHVLWLMKRGEGTSNSETCSLIHC